MDPEEPVVGADPADAPELFAAPEPPDKPDPLSPPDALDPLAIAEAPEGPAPAEEPDVAAEPPVPLVCAGEDAPGGLVPHAARAAVVRRCRPQQNRIRKT